VTAEEIVAALARARIGDTYNQYADSELRRRRLAAYLASRAEAPLVLVGEAAGYRGARLSGIPFTSERQLTGVGPAEATATIVHRVLGELGLEEEVLLWNVVPTHPGTEKGNRRPTREEVEASLPFLRAAVRGRRAIAVGRLAQAVLGAPYVRHPAHGGARSFRSGLAAILGSQAGNPARQKRCHHLLDELLPPPPGEEQPSPLGEQEAAHTPVARSRQAVAPGHGDQAAGGLGVGDPVAGQAA
jgi:uracil-DNA glycosylase family 4